jgi:Nitronate monooxygenase
MHTVGSAAEARRRVGDGVDVIVAQGVESGGHVWGQVASMALVPAVADAVGPVPVVAAGGIADARGIAAAMALGASGVWMGTASWQHSSLPRIRRIKMRCSGRWRQIPSTRVCLTGAGGMRPTGYCVTPRSRGANGRTEALVRGVRVRAR